MAQGRIVHGRIIGAFRAIVGWATEAGDNITLEAVMVKLNRGA